MSTFALEIWDDQGTLCTFYTVRKYTGIDAINAESETDKFFIRFADSGDFEDEIHLLARLITENIGNKYGATDDFFTRFENKAHALPPKPGSKVEEIKEFGLDFPLRLFCYRISESIVILFNGGIKNGQTAQESDLSMQFYEAQLFASKIEEALKDEMIKVSKDGRQLLNYDDSTEIIL